MIKKILTALVLLFSLSFYAQINFEKGYFIDNNNVKTECFIRDEGWGNNPIKFEYRNSENEAASIQKSIENVKEFGMGNSHKYVRFEGNIDTSNPNIGKWNNIAEPEWAKKTLFLRVIIEGDPTLYEYISDNTRRYFYSFNNSPVEQLIYKKYLASNNSDILKNNSFQRQLWSKVKCEEIPIDKFLKMEYTKNDLSEYFIEVNECKKTEFTDFTNPAKSTKPKKVDVDRPKGSFNIKLKAGFNGAANEDVTTRGFKQFHIGDKMFPKYGFEVEHMLPFNRNKWGIYLATSYQKHKYTNVSIHSSLYLEGIENTTTSQENVKYFLFDLGIKHYMYLNSNCSIFISLSNFYNAKTYSSQTGNSEHTFKNSEAGFGKGIGFDYRHKYNFEFRAGDGYAKYSLTLGYTIFNTKKHKK